MPNLMLTTACNFQCEYCFGRDLIGADHPDKMMSWDLFIKLLDWMGKEDVADLRAHLMGGEPTLQPLFADMLREILRRGIKPAVFSNAAYKIDQDILRESVEAGVRWIVNCNPPKYYHGDQLEVMHRNLHVLGDTATVTFNITDPDTEFEYVFEYILEHNLNREIKTGVTLPTISHNNTFVTRPDFKGVSDRIMELAGQAKAHGINIVFECGVPFCLFTEAQKAELGDTHVSHCGSRLDITPEGKVINCLPLSSVAAIPYDTFRSYAEARGWFRQAFQSYGSLGMDFDCLECKDLTCGNCSVCMAHSMHDLNRIVLPALPGD